MNDQNYPEESQAVVVLVLGIVSLVAPCLILGPVAWIMGNTELAAIDAGRRAPENRGMAMAGKVLGIVSSGLIILGVGGFLVFAIILPLFFSFAG